MMWRTGFSPLVGLLLSVLFTALPARAATVEYELTIAREEVNLSGKPTRGMTINGSIPGPVLRFEEGDMARIHVHNRMIVDTSIHWHGLLVPPDMDGVPYISFPPIPPGVTFTYEFPIRQSGTYWYHSHTSLQEQSGVYGPIVIEPRSKEPRADRDYVVLFSDWTDEDPRQVNRTLKRGSEWYAIQKGSGQSILGAARLGLLADYFQRELQRMPPMDIADVAYARFLANGRPETFLSVKPNETVRLRIIDGSATTYFHLEFAGGPMTIIAADGQEVEPVEQGRFLVGVAEVYDVLIKVPSSGAYEFRATAHDGSGYASVWIGEGERHSAPIVPKPNLYQAMGKLSLKQIFALTPAGTMGMPDNLVEAGHFDRPGMAGHSMENDSMPGMKNHDHGSGTSSMKMDGRDHPAGAFGRPHEGDKPMSHPASPVGAMEHGSPSQPTTPPVSRIGNQFGTHFGFLATDISASPDLAVDGRDPRRPWPPYAKLRSTRPTAYTKGESVREIRLTLDGDMERYVWFLNNRALSESDSIRIRQGEVVRFIMINRTMMHHPMHLHGHFFRVINGQGDYAPLKHTVDVAPMSTTVIEFLADEVGDWFFHCHLLYHMEAGMARVVHYEDFTLSPQLAAIRPNLFQDSWYFWGQGDLLSNMTEGFLMTSNTRHILTAGWEVGWQNQKEIEWESLLTWDYYLNRFFTVFVGSDLLGEGNELTESRAVLGLRYLLPFHLESRLWLDSNGGLRVNLGKSFRLTPRLTLFGEAQYDTHDLWEGRAGLSYLVQKNVSIVAQWHSHYSFGAGLQIRF